MSVRRPDREPPAGLDELAVEAAEGDPSAMTDLLSRLQPKIVRYCRARIGNHRSDFHRKHGRDRSHPVADLPETPHNYATGPEALAIQGENRGEIARLLDVLTPHQREILNLRVAAGLSAEDTAEALSSSPGAVRVAQHRALNRLRIEVTRDPSAHQLRPGPDPNHIAPPKCRGPQ